MDSARHRFHGQNPSISTSSEKLKTTRMATMIARIPTLSSDWSTTIVRMMSAMISTSRPSRMTLLRFFRRSANAFGSRRENWNAK